MQKKVQITHYKAQKMLLSVKRTHKAVERVHGAAKNPQKKARRLHTTFRKVPGNSLLIRWKKVRKV